MSYCYNLHQMVLCWYQRLPRLTHIHSLHCPRWQENWTDMKHHTQTLVENRKETWSHRTRTDTRAAISSSQLVLRCISSPLIGTQVCKAITNILFIYTDSTIVYNTIQYSKNLYGATVQKNLVFKKPNPLGFWGFIGFLDFFIGMNSWKACWLI